MTLRRVGSIVQVLLSFNEQDVAIAEAFRATLFVLAPEIEFFFSPILFEGYRTLELKDADAFLLLVGPRGLSEIQLRQYGSATLRNKNHPEFVMICVVAAANVPEAFGTPGLTWIEVPIATDRAMVQQVIDALLAHGKFVNQSRTTKFSLLRGLGWG